MILLGMFICTGSFAQDGDLLQCSMIQLWLHHHDQAVFVQDAVERGWLRSPGISRPDPQKVLHVAWEVASALTCLHNLGLAHGNLTTSNVLLSDSPDAPTGFMAKVRNP